jgi:nucleotide-binding universal stress UspA family protein
MPYGRHHLVVRLEAHENEEKPLMRNAQSSQPRVVVGVDGSEQSKAALRWAARIAAAEDVGIDAVGAWEFPTNLGWSVLPVEYSPKLDVEKALTETVDEVFGAHRPADLQLLTHEGGAAHVLLAHSQGARMLVVGSRGHGGFAGMLIGSVSAHVAEHATCPVLVVHGDIPSEGTSS